MADQPQKASFIERFKQIGVAFRYTARQDKLFVPLVALAVAVPLVASIVAVGVGARWVWVVVGVCTAPLAAMLVLNVRINNAMMNEAEGKPGAAAAILQTVRGDWRITPAVQATTQQDFVHRAIGRPGVVLIAEGNGSRVKSLLGQEKKRLSRVVGDTPIY